jgi:hypothetical protein
MRISNGVIIVDQRTGLDPNAFGWLPGEVLVIHQGAPPPTVLAPTPLPQHMIQLPASLLSLQKELQGFSESRQGKPSEGNISADLFDASLWQAHYMTRLRGRLLSESLQRLAQIVFYVDARYKSIADRIPSLEKNDFQQYQWTPIAPDSYSDYDAHLDPGSLQIISAGAMRSVLAALSKSGVIPTRTLLEGFNVPGAAEIAEENMQEKGLQAMGRLKRPR